MTADFATQAKLAGLPAHEPEFAFCYGRKWAFDFAWPSLKVALEIEGGTRKGGRHNRHKGFSEDAEKYNQAALLGWLLIRATTEQVASGQALSWVEQALLVRSQKQ